MHKGTVTPDEARACVRALVGVIRSASSGSSPVDDGQVAHLKKVVKVLSAARNDLRPGVTGFVQRTSGIGSEKVHCRRHNHAKIKQALNPTVDSTALQV